MLLDTDHLVVQLQLAKKFLTGLNPLDISAHIEESLADPHGHRGPAEVDARNGRLPCDLPPVSGFSLEPLDRQPNLFLTLELPIRLRHNNDNIFTQNAPEMLITVSDSCPQLASLR